MGEPPDFMATRHGYAVRLPRGAAAFLVGAAILTLPDVRVRHALGRTAEQAASTATLVAQQQPPAPGATKKGPDEPRRTMEIRVINGRTGQPEPGVSVRARIPAGAEGTTDADGRYRLVATDRGFAVLWLAIRKPGFVPIQLTWDNAMAEVPVEIPREHTVTLEPASTIGGIVRDEQGQPIVGATVGLSIPSSGNQRPGQPRVDLNNFRTQTDAEGRWRCDMAPAKLDILSITVEHPDYLSERNPFWRRSESPREFADLQAGKVVLVLKEGATVEGRVSDRDGHPIAGARVTSASPNRRGAATTDDRGHFELAHLPSGPIELTVQARGYVPARQKVVAGPDAAPVEVRLEAGRAVSGRLVDEANQPIAGAFVHFELGPSNQAIQPGATSDRDGRFRIDGIPVEGGNLVVRQGPEMVTRRLPPSEKDESVTLTVPKAAQMHVRITATDAGSGQPIPAFSVVLRGSIMGRHAATGGRYEMTMHRPPSRPGFPPLQVRIEADGYFPSELRKVPTDGKEIDLAFALKRGAAIAGIVRAPGGTPVPKAELALRSPSQRITFDGDRLRNVGVYPIIQTGEDGRFRFPPQEGPFVLVAAHPLGFSFRAGESVAGQQETPLEITLRPWGRVEGVFKIGSRPAANRDVSLLAPFRSDISSLEVHWQDTTTTDNEGRFVFERVLPGFISIQRTIRINPRHGVLDYPAAAIEVKAGETARMVVGGAGRPVVGRVALPAELGAKWGSLQPTGRISVDRRPPRPYEQLTAEEQAHWDREWQKDHRSHAFVIQPDGSFRVEDIAPGPYQLRIQINEDYDEPRFHGFITLGTIERAIAVPEIPAGLARTDEPLDLGLFPFAIDRGVGVGEPAPEVAARTFDDKPLKLSDYRGKYVLMVFWQSATTLDRAELLALKAVASIFGRDDRFIMLGLNADTQGDEARARAAQHGWSWPQAKLGGMTGWNLRQKFGAYDLPSIWLVGPDGRVVARDLRGAAIKEAVARALRDR